MSRTRSVIVGIAMLIVAAIGLAACGGDDDAKTSATATTSSGASATAAGGSATTSGGEATSTEAADETTAPAAGTQPAGSGIEVSDSCALISKEEVEDALGETISEPSAVDVINAPIAAGVNASIGGCGWTSESFASSISLSYYSAPGHGDAIGAMVDLACQGKEEIDGLGDKACWYDQQHVQIQLARGESFLDIFATMSGDASSVLETLAEKASERLS